MYQVGAVGVWGFAGSDLAKQQLHLQLQTRVSQTCLLRHACLLLGKEAAQASSAEATP